MDSAKRPGLAERRIVACGGWHIGWGLYFMLLRPALLPEDIRYLAVDAQSLRVLVPGRAPWLAREFTVMGGFMAGAGVLIAFFGWKAMPLQPSGTTIALLLRGALTVGLMSAVNFALHSDFRWLLALPPAGWLVAVVRYGRGSGWNGLSRTHP